MTVNPNILPWSAMTTMLTQLWRPLWYRVSINRDNMSSTFFSWSLTSSLSGPPPCPAWSGWSKYRVMKSGFSSSGSVSQSMTSHTLSGNPTFLFQDIYKNDSQNVKGKSQWTKTVLTKLGCYINVICKLMYQYLDEQLCYLKLYKFHINIYLEYYACICSDCFYNTNHEEKCQSLEMLTHHTSSTNLDKFLQAYLTN